jgi:hypothetical protein
MTRTHTGDRVLEQTSVTDVLFQSLMFFGVNVRVATDRLPPTTRCQEEARATANESVLTTLFAEHHSG